MKLQLKLFVILLAMIAAFAAFSACNVTRTITTTSSAFQRGDTAVTIQTKTVEVYDGTLKR